MKLIPALFRSLIGVVLFFLVVFPFGACTKKVTTIVYRDTTIIQYRDTTIFKDSTVDKQTYIHLAGITAGSNTTPLVATNFHIPAFDIRNYTNVDSVVFSCKSYVQSGSGAMIAQLYDVTDGQVIGGSIAAGTAPVATYPNFVPFARSGNFIDSIPKKPIDLSIKVNVSDNNTLGVLTDAYLILYRK